ncbi:hypothetical protein RB195_021665 [Necator americanus]|uniref:HAT C-terminal dimerisation domain-containing protein n=1 Tax=Necator americanus TaxID=51031 RepID=A0ABR1EC44_NECAM
MLLHLLSALTLLLASEDLVCHPFLSEFSTLRFRTTADLQYIELAVTEECRSNVQAMKEMKISSYGLLVLNTKSPLKDKERKFFTSIFADFNNEKWPKNKEFQAFFVIGSQEPDGSVVPPGNFPRAERKLHFNFYNLKAKAAKCSRLINWAFCNLPSDQQEQGQKSPHEFFPSSSRTEPPQIHHEDYYRDGQSVFIVLHFKGKDAEHFAKLFSYVETSRRGNAVYRERNLHITLEKQEWLSSRIVDIVVFSPSDDVSKVIPMERLDNLWPDINRQMVFHVLPENSLTPQNSVSLCGSKWAITKRTPGYDNECEGEGFDRYLEQWNRRPDNPIRRGGMTTTTTTTTISPVEGGSPDREYPGSPTDFGDTAADEFPAFPLGNAGLQYSRLEASMSKLLEKVQHIENKQQMFGDAQMALAAESQHTTNLLKTMMSELKERNELQKAEIELEDLNLRRKFCLHRDENAQTALRRNLQQVGINGESFTVKQIEALVNKPYLEYYRDASRPQLDFMRCSLCNKDEIRFNPEDRFRTCASEQQMFGKNVNLLGRGRVLCLNKMSGSASRNPRYGISRVLNRLTFHEASKAHTSLLDSFKREAARVRDSVSSENVAATVTSTFAAYTIAKEGLPYSTQFPLLVMAMRAGAVGTSAHYDPTTVHRMIKSFAVHMKYDLVKYLVQNRMPFSVLLDGSTSSRGVKWIVFLVKTVSPQHRPITFHFFLSDVESETANHTVEAFLGHLNEMESWAEAPGLSETIRNYAMKNMVGLSSDGAAVMQGHIGGVYARMKNLIQESTRNDAHPRNNLILSVCMAHKLNLAVTTERGYFFQLTEAVAMEMYHIFGTTVRTVGRRVYKRVAKQMGYPYLQMRALFKVRWAASLVNSVSNILRVYPVLLQTLEILKSRNRFPAETVKRAKIASWVLMDGRTFIAMHHVHTVLEVLAYISLSLQEEEALPIDLASSWRGTAEALTSNIYNIKTERQILERGVLKMYDRSTNKYSHDYSPSRGGHSEEEEEEQEQPEVQEEEQESRAMLNIKLFRNLELAEAPAGISLTQEDPDLAYHIEDSPDFDLRQLRTVTLGRVYEATKPTTSVADAAFHFYQDVARALQQHMESGREYELRASDLIALKRQTIIDIVEFAGDFESGIIDYVPSDWNFPDRGCPEYINQEEQRFNPSLRHELILHSIGTLERYCNIAVRDKKFGSPYLYEQHLKNSHKFGIAEEVAQAIRCVLVIPASNADSERSFSAANRLSREERSNINTETLDHLMTVQRNGPSLLTVKLEQLASQWIHPLPGLRLRPGKPSTYEKEGSLMKEVKHAIATGNVDSLTALNVRRHMILHGLSHRSDSDVMKHRLEEQENAKSSIFKIGSKSAVFSSPEL